jgi:hypothetical protein
MRPMLSSAFKVGLMIGLYCCASQLQVNGQGKINVVRFPDEWWMVDRDGAEVLPLEPIIYKAWKLPVSGELLVGVATRPVRLKTEVSESAAETPARTLSKNFYAVSLDGRVRKISEQERRRGEAVTNGYAYIGDYKKTHTTLGINHGGKLFLKSGKSWAGTVGILSPGGNWLAVFSYTSPDKPLPETLPGMGGSEPGRGVIFVDVYDVATGDKVLAGKHAYKGHGPSDLFGSSVWIADHHLILPFDTGLQNCLLITLPNHRQG